MPLPSWLPLNTLRRLADLLAPHGVWVVGGAVRCLFTGENTTDIDLATSCPPQQTWQLLTQAGLNALPTGLAHGTVSVQVEGYWFEITTLRHDITTTGRHATVAFTTSLAADAARRDFTINALYFNIPSHPTSQAVVTDFFGGVPHLRSGTIVFIGHAHQRIKEDHLRLLRFIRFYAHYGKTPPSPDTLAVLKRHMPLLTRLSPERITAEFKKMFPFLTEDVVRLMQQTNVLQVLGMAPMLALLPALSPQTPWLATWLALGGEKVVNNPFLRFSKAEQKQLKKVAETFTQPNCAATTPHQLAALLGVPVAQALVWLNGQPQAAAMLEGYHPPVFPVTGSDLLVRGVQPGPALGKALYKLKLWWISNNFPNKTHCLTHLNSIIK